MRHPRAVAPVSPPTTPLAAQAAVAILGNSAADVAREALRIARAESRARPVLLVDLLGEGSALDRMRADDDPHGVSDAARYGLSLSRVVRPMPHAESLYVVPGGAESPLSDDVLRDAMWGSWTEQCRRAGALLVVAGPADLPAVGRAVDQLDGMVIVGDATPPPSHVPILGRVRAPRQRANAVVARLPRRISPEEIAVIRQAAPRRSRLVMAVALLVIGGAAGATWWASANGLIDLPGRGQNAPAAAVAPSESSSPDASGIVPVAEDRPALEWSVEIASVNSLAGALTRVRQSLFSLPVPTLAVARPSGGGPTWYRLLAGAYATEQSAESLLAALRDRGVLDPGGGQVVRVPFTWLMEARVPVDSLDDRLFGWRTIGMPAYALLDADGHARVYAGAFETDSAAQMFRPILDSLNLHATLSRRVGSIR